ncbi:hypothetical protein HDV04_002778 [Boothiomyces sp. JEL0838]|nr:hypothetical protein HDV04_002778 [Boothiomyces sp. JEL0838]
MSLTINWKGKKQSVHFDDEYAKYQDEWTAHVTLQQLISKLANASGVPEDRIKLLHGGVLMKALGTTLAKYGITNNSKIMMLGDRPPKHLTPDQRLEKDLDGYLNDVQVTIIPKIKALQEGIEKRSTPIKELKYLSLEIPELLLQILFKVDNIQSDDDGVRMKRKQVVQTIQQHMDKVDELKLSLKSLL